MRHMARRMWRFSGPVAGGPADLYNTFWRKAIAWLTHAPDLQRLPFLMVLRVPCLQQVPYPGGLRFDVRFIGLTGLCFKNAALQAHRPYRVFPVIRMTDLFGKYHVQGQPQSFGDYRAQRQATPGNGQDHCIGTPHLL
jgi:hypothetical protein